jgi:hypothetical protein
LQTIAALPLSGTRSRHCRLKSKQIDAVQVAPRVLQHFVVSVSHNPNNRLPFD